MGNHATFWKKYVCFYIVFALLIVCVPLVQTHLIHRNLRSVPGRVEALDSKMATEPSAGGDTAGNAPAEAAPAKVVKNGVTFDYGYSPEDDWMERDCAFTLNSDKMGLITLRLWYPDEITGNETFNVYINDKFYKTMALSADLSDFEIKVASNAEVHIRLSFHFGSESGQDVRDLAVVLNEIKVY